MASNDILAKMGLDSKGFDAGLKSVEGRTSSFVGKLGSLFAGISLAAFGRQVLNYADSVQDASEKLDLSAESLQRFESAFGKAGASSETFQRGFGLFLEKLDQARNGSDEAAKAFERVGISLDDIKKLSPEQLFMKFADGIKNSKDNAEMLSKSFGILGKSGRELKTGLAQGGDALRDSMNRAVVATDEEIAKVAELNDRLNELKRTALSIGASAASFDYIGAVTGQTNEQSRNDMNRASSEAYWQKRNRQERIAAAQKEFQEKKKLEVKAAEEAQKEILNDNWGATSGNPKDAAMSAGIAEVGNDLAEKQASYIEDWESSYNDMIESEAEAKDKQREKDEKSAEKVYDKWGKGADSFAKKIKEAAEGLDKEADEFLKSGQQRREERQEKRDKDRALRTAKSRREDKADSKARGAYGSEEERQKIEADKRAGIKGADGKGPGIGGTDKGQAALENIDAGIAELIGLYGKST